MKNKIKRKWAKLKRDPKLFFEDMFIKYINFFKKYFPIKYQGQNQFTVVSAVYNVEKYLDEYFSSLTRQSLNFKKHIQIILVDDGSIIFTKKMAARPRHAIWVYNMLKPNG